MSQHKTIGTVEQVRVLVLLSEMRDLTSTDQFHADDDEGMDQFGRLTCQRRLSEELDSLTSAIRTSLQGAGNLLVGRC